MNDFTRLLDQMLIITAFHKNTRLVLKTKLFNQAKATQKHGTLAIQTDKMISMQGRNNAQCQLIRPTRGGQKSNALSYVLIINLQLSMFTFLWLQI